MRIPYTPKSNKNLSYMGVIPVAKRAAHCPRSRCPTAPFQHSMLPVKIRLGIPPVGIMLKSGIAVKPGRRPLPNIAQHIIAAIRTLTPRKSTDRSGLSNQMIVIGAIAIRQRLTPRIGQPLLSCGIPTGSFFPLCLRWQSFPDKVGVGFRLIPAHPTDWVIVPGRIV